jgi:hypothetical protein
MIRYIFKTMPRAIDLELLQLLEDKLGKKGHKIMEKGRKFQLSQGLEVKAWLVINLS